MCVCSTGRDQAGVLRIPEEVSQLTLLEALSIDFAGAPPHPQDSSYCSFVRRQNSTWPREACFVTCYGHLCKASQRQVREWSAHALALIMQLPFKHLEIGGRGFWELVREWERRRADHRYREHPGLGNQLVAARGMAKLQRLRSLSLRCCALMGDAWADAWADAWPGLTSLADLTFGSCLGDSVSQQLPRICAAAPPQLRRLAVTDAHAVTLSAPLVHIGCLDLSRLTSLQVRVAGSLVL